MAEFLAGHPAVRFVRYPPPRRLLPRPRSEVSAERLLRRGELWLQRRAAAEQFMKSLKIAQIATHVADARTCCLHPANATHAR